MSQVAVLKLMKKVKEISVKDASKRLGISLTACWNNFKRLEREGIIIKIKDSCKYKYNGKEI